MGRFISLKADDGHEFSAYEAGDPGATRGLVLVQEIFGLTSYIQATCDRLAEQGYHVIAPALFDRAQRDADLPYTAEGASEGMALRGQIATEDTLRDIEAAASALGTKRRGIIGFCWGGLIAWLTATRTRAVHAAVGWYGGGIAQVAEEKPHCPVQLHFGGADTHISHLDVQTIRSAQPHIELFVYDDAGHGFGCTDRPDYQPDAAELAFARSLAFFDAHL
ncbi:dienelactone hydrolase family protein [Tanticharoenia sakaeratensis]|jgi:carboxymethylenebutenolidase|uniref:Carboxymethylenebutenolidase n=1 Tax=Tanticharoenia sakaeratensis NBRC 103193 TaxID=1231623 RepID=A0A0D6MKA3_9PROT|nr:dienelactone hydrolase family protein [Tanticharoenia sakaeratensis]GAN53901.1 carboxymethylenebutenolidase [Tanticharoenia sakaeratensis NBRC 103193]GBQ25216.1 carboxymethylenebutenolidase [Tanticharoenia sakaeratensis NBRC 103193]